MTAKLTIALAVSALTIASVLTAPAEARTLRDFFVHSTAMSLGRGDSVIGAAGGPVRVAALLPTDAVTCYEVASVTQGYTPAENRRIEGLRGVPVTVVLEPGDCHRFQPNRVFFTVAHPVTTDILNVTFETPNGRVLTQERLQIEGNERSGDPD